MYYVIQENLFREYGFKALKEHLERYRLGYEIVRFVPFSNELNVKTDRKDVFFFGSINGGKIGESYGWNPGHLINENFTFEKYLPMYGENLLSSDGCIISVRDEIPERYGNIFFARPAEDTKQFTGEVFTKAIWEAWMVDLNDSNMMQGVSESTKVFVSSPKSPIQQEIRCWIVDGEPVTISQYKIGNRVNYLNMDNNEEALIFARKMSKIFSPAKAFCLDICLYEDEYRIVELGCINHCGFYDANMSKIIQAIEQLYQQ